MEKCYANLKLTYSGKFHANQLSAATVNALIQQLIPELKERDWQPVRLVNKEEISYGTRRETIYTNMVAELVLRIIEERAKHSEQRTSIHFTGAQFAHRKGAIIPKIDYKQQIQSYLGFAALRRGLTEEQLKWNLLSVHLFDAKVTPELQICDLLSYASYENYKRCSPQIKPRLQAAFDVFDQTMKTRDLLGRVDELIEGEEQAFGIALIRLVESLYHSDDSGHSRESTINRLNHIIDRLIQIGARGRNAHLMFLISWLDQLIGQQRLLETGYSVAHLLLNNLEQPLRTRLESINQEKTIDWFSYAVRRWALTSANHRGALLDAERECQAMQQLQESLAQQWEQVPLLTDGFIVQAVHQADCFDFRQAGKRLELIADSLKVQSQILQNFMSGGNAQPIHFDVRAKALGTLIQCLTLAGLDNASDLQRARSASDEAINEFISLQDKARQFQYRCHLETVAKDFVTARRFLMKALRPLQEPADISHQGLAHAIRRLETEDGFNFRFTLMHWLRIGAKAGLAEDSAEFNSFTKAFGSAPFNSSDWCTGKIEDWPAHLILRFIAIVQALSGQTEASITSLQKLDEITPNDGKHLTLSTITLAAYAEATAILWERPEAKSLIEVLRQKGLQIKQDLEFLQQNTTKHFSTLENKIQYWQDKIESIYSGEMDKGAAQSTLLSIAKDILY